MPETSQPPALVPFVGVERYEQIIAGWRVIWERPVGEWRQVGKVAVSPDPVPVPVPAVILGDDPYTEIKQNPPSVPPNKFGDHLLPGGDS